MRKNDRVVNGRSRFMGLLLLIVPCVFVGCSDFGKVTGTVTMDGKPLPGVAVRFEDEGGSATIAPTDANGKFELRYSIDQAGAPIGKHKVTILTAGTYSESTGVRTKEIVPAKYNRDSELSAEVKRGSQTINFELTSAP